VPQVVKQPLNVDSNEVDRFTQTADYLRYRFAGPVPAGVGEAPADETSDAKKARLKATKIRKALTLKSGSGRGAS
jgi:hypothetical protein